MPLGKIHLRYQLTLVGGIFDLIQNTITDEMVY